MNLRREGILFALVGPTAGGKTTIGAHLLEQERGALRLSISATSRAPRAGEEEGKHYYFMSRAEFEAAEARGEFFEWEEIHGNLYGTKKSTVEEALTRGMDLLLDIDIRGALNFQRFYPGNTVICFLVPPSAAELLRRLKSRSSVTEEELQRRLATAREEYRTILLNLEQRTGSVNYLLVNDDLARSCDLVHSILKIERLSLKRLHVDDIEQLCKI